MLLFPPRSRRKRRQLEQLYRQFEARKRFMLDGSVHPLAQLERLSPRLLGVDRRTREAFLHYLPTVPRTRPPVPDVVPVVAVRDGIVAFVSGRPDDISITVDHRNGFLTRYSGLAEAAVQMCKKVECGQVIGQLRLDVGHLRFEILKNFIDELPFPFALDPAPFLAVWPQVPLKATPAQEAA